MKITIMNKFLFIALFAVVQQAYATKNIVILETKEKIYKLLSSIPSGNESLAYKFNSLGLAASSVMLSEADDSDINDGSFMYQKDDKFVDIYFKSPIPTNPLCEIWQPVRFKIRKNKYFPESRTSNFLLNGKCVAPK